jgi:hypothetical protein
MAAEVGLLRLADAHGRHAGKCERRTLCGTTPNFSEEQLIELAASAALENFRARYNRVFDVGSDGLYRKGLRAVIRRCRSFTNCRLLFFSHPGKLQGRNCEW